MSPDGLCLIESASEEHSIEFSGAEGLLVSFSQDPADAVLNPDDEYLSWHVRRTHCMIAQRAPTLDLTRIDHQYIRFRSKLIAALLDEPIEDGVTHPAEHVIDEALRTNSSECRDWLSRVLVEHYQTRPSISASIVRCIGRLEYDQVGRWGMRVADHALRDKDVEVREAAVRALEAWGGCEALSILRSHSDSLAWLNEYVGQVIVDLSGTT
ncbi:MAG: hypothetical protein IID38_08745 [Planctomycetes bacterium]|nr:hypothetical protein [Planctomycetota bacterium]